MTADRISEAIDRATDAHIAKLFEVLCLELRNDGAIGRFRTGLEITLRARDAAIDVAKEKLQ